MRTNRRRANLFKVDSLIEKKNCQRCYRLHKKCDGVTPSCSGCSKSKSACIYTYDSAENALNTLDTSKVDMEINLTNLQHSLELQKQSYQFLQDQLEQLKSHNLTLQKMNSYLSQALSTQVLQENQLALASEKQDLLGIYTNTGYLHIRVKPPFSDVYQYKQEKELGRNSLKTVTMEFILGAAYLLLGKRNEGYHYINSARDEMMMNNLNTPMGLICMFMMAENYLIDGKKFESSQWLQKISAMFVDMENSLKDPNKAPLVNNQLIMMSQLIDVNFVRTMSILWTQWAPQYFTGLKQNRRIDQYLRQEQIANILENSIHQSPRGVPTFYILKTISEIMIAIEHEINSPNDVPFITEQHITMHYNQLVEYLQLTSDPKLRHTFTRGILIIKILVAILTNNSALDQLIVDLIEMGCFTDLCPIPQDAVPLFILLQLLCYARSPYFPKAVQQYEIYANSFPTYAKLYQKWVDIATGPSTYPVELNGFEDYFVMLPHLLYMQQRNITFKLHIPILTEDTTQIDNAVDALLLTPFDAVSSPSAGDSKSDKSPNGNVDPLSESSGFSEEAFTFGDLEENDFGLGAESAIDTSTDFNNYRFV